MDCMFRVEAVGLEKGAPHERNSETFVDMGEEADGENYIAKECRDGRRVKRRNKNNEQYQISFFKVLGDDEWMER